MLTAITNVSRLDWGGWLRGLIGAAVSGGAGAVGSGVGASLLDKQHDLNVMKLMAIAFATSSFISLCKFLQTEPVPPLKAPAA